MLRRNVRRSYSAPSKVQRLGRGPAQCIGSCPLVCGKGSGIFLADGKYGAYTFCDGCDYKCNQKSKGSDCQACGFDTTGTIAEGVKTMVNGVEEWTNQHVDLNQCCLLEVNGTMPRVMKINAGNPLINTPCAVGDEYPAQIGNNIDKTCTGAFKVGDIVLRAWTSAATPEHDGLSCHLKCMIRQHPLMLRALAKERYDRKKIGTCGTASTSIDLTGDDSVNVFDVFRDDDFSEGYRTHV